MREIKAADIENTVARLCIKANCELPEDVYYALKNAYENENLSLAKFALESLIKNAEIAKDKTEPICQDTGIAVVFLELGQDAHIVGGPLYKAVNAGVAKGYSEGYLRASVVADPFFRENTRNNTPAVIHTVITEGEHLKITVCPKGAGSENKSKVKMLVPADGAEGVKNFVLETVKTADADSCPPMVVGVGVGGNLETCALLAKRALLQKISEPNQNSFLAAMEKEILNEINGMGIGPSGFGGKTTALKVSILAAPTHIAQLPVAVNMSCHATRHAEEVL